MRCCDAGLSRVAGWERAVEHCGGFCGFCGICPPVRLEIRHRRLAKALRPTRKFAAPGLSDCTGVGIFSNVWQMETGNARE